MEISLVHESSDLYRKYFCNLIMRELRDFAAAGIVSQWIDGMNVGTME